MGLGSFCDTRGPKKPVLDSGPNGDTSMGFPNFPNIPELNPIRLEVGERSSLADPRLTTHKAHDSVLVASSKTQHDSSGSTESTTEVGSTEPTTLLLTTGLATPVLATGLATPMRIPRSDDDEWSSSVNQVHVASPIGVTQSEAEGVVSTHQHWASPMEVSGCTELLLKMGFRFSSNQNSTLGFNMLSGGLISEGKRSVILEFVPRLVGPSLLDLFLDFLRARSIGLGVSGQEANSFSSKELLNLSREVLHVEDVVDFSMGFGATEVSDCLPLQTIAPAVPTISAELEEATEVLSIEKKIDISGWVKHRIPGSSKLVRLSTNQHEKLCTALLQRLEIVMEAANVLHRKETGSKKVAKSKNKGRRELQNLIYSVNYDRR